VARWWLVNILISTPPQEPPHGDHHRHPRATEVRHRLSRRKMVIALRGRGFARVGHRPDNLCFAFHDFFSFLAGTPIGGVRIKSDTSGTRRLKRDRERAQMGRVAPSCAEHCGSHPRAVRQLCAPVAALMNARIVSLFCRSAVGSNFSQHERSDAHFACTNSPN